MTDFLPARSHAAAGGGLTAAVTTHVAERKSRGNNTSTGSTGSCHNSNNSASLIICSYGPAGSGSHKSGFQDTCSSSPAGTVADCPPIEKKYSFCESDCDKTTDDQFSDCSSALSSSITEDALLTKNKGNSTTPNSLQRDGFQSVPELVSELALSPFTANKRKRGNQKRAAHDTASNESVHRDGGVGGDFTNRTNAKLLTRTRTESTTASFRRATTGGSIDSCVTVSSTCGSAGSSDVSTSRKNSGTFVSPLSTRPLLSSYSANSTTQRHGQLVKNLGSPLEQFCKRLVNWSGEKGEQGSFKDHKNTEAMKKVLLPLASAVAAETPEHTPRSVVQLPDILVTSPETATKKTAVTAVSTTVSVTGPPSQLGEEGGISSSPNPSITENVRDDSHVAKSQDHGEKKACSGQRVSATTIASSNDETARVTRSNTVDSTTPANDARATPQKNERANPGNEFMPEHGPHKDQSESGTGPSLLQGQLAVPTAEKRISKFNDERVEVSRRSAKYFKQNLINTNTISAISARVLVRIS